MSWLTKYNPTKIEELIISDGILNTITNWITNFKEGTGSNCIYIYGPSGIGKTTLAHLILKHYNYRIIERNMSNIKKRTQFKEDMNCILNQKNIINMFNNVDHEFAIILDEIEGISSKESYIIKDIIDIIFTKKKYRYKQKNPFILISTSIHTKFKIYKKRCEVLEIKTIPQSKVYNYCEKILKTEKIFYIKDDIYKIINKHQDIRQIIINLEYNYFNNTTATIDKKNKEYSDYNIVQLLYDKFIFNNIIHISKNLTYMIFFENFIDILCLNKDIINIYKEYSDSDILDYYVYKYMYWELFEYNTVHKLVIPSFIINNTTKKEGSVLRFSSLLNKNSLEFINIKIINKYSNLITKHSNSLNIYDLSNIIYITPSGYDIDKVETKKILKFIKDK